MSKRLQVLFDDEELAELREIARRNHMSLAEWVRQTLREARSRQRAHGRALKHEALQKAIAHEFPTGDVEEMLSQLGCRPPV